MSRTISHTSYSTEIEIGDRVRYVNWPDRIDRRGRHYPGPRQTRVGTVIELHEEERYPDGFIKEWERAVVEFDDGSVDAIEGWRFLLSLNDGREVIRQLEILV